MPNRTVTPVQKPTNQLSSKFLNNQLVLGLSILGTVTYSLAIPIIAFTLLGHYLDQRTNHSFLFTIICGLAGLGLGLFSVYRQANDLKNKVYGKPNSTPSKDQPS